jgi:hypothetical protein
VVSFDQFSHQNPVCTSPVPHTCHTAPISFFLTLSAEQYLMRNRDYKAHRYVIFSTPLLHILVIIAKMYK